MKRTRFPHLRNNFPKFPRVMQFFKKFPPPHGGAWGRFWTSAWNNERIRMDWKSFSVFIGHLTSQSINFSVTWLDLNFDLTWEILARDLTWLDLKFLKNDLTWLEAKNRWLAHLWFQLLFLSNRLNRQNSIN